MWCFQISAVMCKVCFYATLCVLAKKCFISLAMTHNCAFHFSHRMPIFEWSPKFWEGASYGQQMVLLSNQELILSMHGIASPFSMSRWAIVGTVATVKIAACRDCCVVCLLLELNFCSTVDNVHTVSTSFVQCRLWTRHMQQAMLYITLAGQPGVAQAFALRAEVCRFAPLAPLSFFASRSLHPEVNTLPYEENCSSIVELA